jgi:hypothetical protein
MPGEDNMHYEVSVENDDNETIVWVTVQDDDDDEIAVGIDWHSHEVRIQDAPDTDGPVVEVPLRMLRSALHMAINEAAQRQVVEAVSSALERMGLGGEMHDAVLESVEHEDGLAGIGGLHL